MMNNLLNNIYIHTKRYIIKILKTITSKVNKNTDNIQKPI